MKHIRKLVFISIIITTLLICRYSYNEYLLYSLMQPINTLNLKHTILTPVLNTAINNNYNYIYCSTFQTSWNQLRNSIIKDKIILNRQHYYINELNFLSNQNPLLDEENFVSLAGGPKDKIIEKVYEAQSKFNISCKVKYKQYDETDIMLFSALNKNFSFTYPFQEYHRIEYDNYEFTSSSGQTSEIQRVGLYEYLNVLPTHKNIAQQIKILYFNEPHRDAYYFCPAFPTGSIIQLIPNNSSDEIIISTVPKSSTLIKSFENINDIITKKIIAGNLIPYYQCYAKEIYDIKFDGPSSIRIFIPKINFNLLHYYSEFEDKIANNLSTNYSISDAIQQINVKFNNFSVLTDKIYFVRNKPLKTILIDKPFFMYFKKPSSNYPYLLAYICNDELLSKKEFVNTEFEERTESVIDPDDPTNIEHTKIYEYNEITEENLLYKTINNFLDKK